MNLRFVLLVLPQFISSHSLVFSWYFGFDTAALEVISLMKVGSLAYLIELQLWLSVYLLRESQKKTMV